MNKFSKFGSKVFNEEVMKEKLPSPIFHKWKEATNKQDALDRPTADAIAHAMKEWALAQGCTHYTHWFQPLTGLTAEKHESFIDIRDGQTILKFSGKNLIKGEPDASSFPSGGLRATFEARGYTYWDCTSPAFIRNNILYIPTLFVSFNGEALDGKSPLLKSVDALSKHATRIVNMFGDKDCKGVVPTLGLEQEYFLVDRATFNQRSDLFLTNHTLLGSLPPKGQEFSPHYLGSIPSRVAAFMEDVNNQLWELGIYAKTEHNEVAPSQFELASIYMDANLAIDQNHIIMDVLQKTALKHNMVCLLHEKPYKGVNGSGKHNNWSLVTTNNRTNLLNPGKNPHENVQFLLFACALIKAVDTYPELIRLMASNPGNDYRLGANEAPPAIVSVFLGKSIEGVLRQLINEKPERYEKSALNSFGIASLSYLPRDNSDRNRTSPVAFTGNKFEFRMLGSSITASNLNIVINTMMADVLASMADQLEDHKYRQDVRKAALDMCVAIIKQHSRILFDGDGYSKEWKIEAAKRGLPNIATYVESIEAFKKDESISLFEKHGVLSKTEILSRVDIMYEAYIRSKETEAGTLIDMIRTEVIPAVSQEIANLALIPSPKPKVILNKEKLFTQFIDDVSQLCDELESTIAYIDTLDNVEKKSFELLKKVTPYLEKIRELYDDVEIYIAKDNLPFPSYRDLLFGLDH